MIKTFTVAVFLHEREPHGSPRAPLYLAYLRDYSPSWKGCCLHRVEAARGADAKTIAIAQHKAVVGCGTGVSDKMVVTGETYGPPARHGGEEVP